MEIKLLVESMHFSIFLTFFALMLSHVERVYLFVCLFSGGIVLLLFYSWRRLALFSDGPRSIECLRITLGLNKNSNLFRRFVYFLLSRYLVPISFHSRLICDFELSTNIAAIFGYSICCVPGSLPSRRHVTLITEKSLATRLQH